MSRSIHTTVTTPRDWGDRRRKRRVKELVLRERERVSPRTDVGRPTVAIVMRDRGLFVHHPVTKAELQRFIERLPSGFVDGLAEVELLLNENERHEDNAEHVEHELDPFVGRLSREIVPGVFGGHLLGRYHPDGPRIQLFAYVYDPATPFRSIIETYLRLRVLATLAHELGHHHDAFRAGPRGRWLSYEDEERSEIYAEAIEHEWMHEYIVPYLEDEFPREVEELRTWVDKHGGFPLDLALLAGDPRTTCGQDGVRLFFRVDMAFQHLFEAVVAGKDALITQIEFANDLHCGEHYEEALVVLSRVLDVDVGNFDARILKADILVHQRRFEEAERLAKAIVREFGGNFLASEVLIDVARSRGDWQTVKTIALEALMSPTPDMPWKIMRMTESQIRAEIELGNWTDVESLLRQLPIERRYLRSIRQLRALVLVRQQKYADAIELAREGLVDTPRSLDLLAVRFEAAYRLGHPNLAPLADEELADLSEQGYADWAAELKKLA